MLADENFISGRKKLSETLSDSAGNFNKGTLEDHNHELKDKLAHQSKIVLVKIIADDLIKTKKEKIIKILIRSIKKIKR